MNTPQAGVAPGHRKASAAFGRFFHGCSMTRSEVPQIVLAAILLSLIGLSVSGLLAIAQWHSNTMQVAR